MQAMFDRLQRWSWLRGLLMILIGAWILIEPHQVYRSFLWIVAAVLIVAAIPKLVDGFSAKKRSGTYGTSLFTGVIYLIVALLLPAIVMPLMSMGPFFIGVVLIIYGINKIMGARRQQQYVNVSPLPTIIYGVALIVIGAIMVINPFKTVMVVFSLFGGLLVVMGIMQLFGSRQQ
ncbi:hypothetical protein BVJ53_09140 [Lacticaseibacillus chiayiensis]|uniref:DUF308 domain-containing protein n=1 Tax=Lacticaseibacillus chiayiensis TaxID=2100821 RepID=A0A4V1P118_9LACO|nr:DUF308 domain-containing protein [Lacticaseibacillus chiayiensis]QVI35279.1 DUF308 domain-containing protein [Lacticaseibacillus chiayiensis]RXT22470.1 hypothetical protein BVJ53_09140 [Lacticaseibacillus chiayiensis]RXT57868.1 hypothetical protein CHT97_09920 [Lacticaseibacillus chiayiensis]UYN57060.1 DUF308 domain-containing protein [Lacticaseibacillus chiayiensis]